MDYLSTNNCIITKMIQLHISLMDYNCSHEMLLTVSTALMTPEQDTIIHITVILCTMKKLCII